MIKLCDSSGNSMSSPAPYFKLEGPVVCQGPHNQVIGCLHEQSWDFAAGPVGKLVCTHRVIVRFLDWQGESDGDCGPYEGLQFREDACYAGDVRVAAYVEGQKSWWRDSDDSLWPRMLIVPASGTPDQ